MTGRTALVVAALLLVPGVSGGQGGEAFGAASGLYGDRAHPASELPHPLHLSTTMLAIDESAAFLRVRMFKNDLERALATAAGRDSLGLTPTPGHDSLFLAYFAERFELRFDGTTSAPPVIIGSGEDLSTEEGDERIWWVELRYDLTVPATRVEVRARQLFEEFDDQRNIVRVLHTGSGRQRTLYFAAPDDGWSDVELR